MRAPQGRRKVSRDEAEASTLTFGPMEADIGFLLSIARLSVLERTYEQLPGETLRIGEFTVLLAIELNPGIRQGVLADILMIKWSNMTKLIRNSEEQGLVERIVPPEDRRAIALQLTAAGIAYVNGLKPLFLETIERSVPMLDKSEQTTLINLLRKIIGWPDI